MRTIRSSPPPLSPLALAAPALAHPAGHGGGLQAVAYHRHPHGLEIGLAALAAIVGAVAYRAWRRNNG